MTSNVLRLFEQNRGVSRAPTSGGMAWANMATREAS
jgi:hypothetical protein